MKTNKKQRNELYNSHIGVGFITFKSQENGLTEFEFFVNKNNKICRLNDRIPSEEIYINQEILNDCIFEED